MFGEVVFIQFNYSIKKQTPNQINKMTGSLGGEKGLVSLQPLKNGLRLR